MKVLKRLATFDSQQTFIQSFDGQYLAFTLNKYSIHEILVFLDLSLAMPYTMAKDSRK
jgi:hypothetical protein